MYRDAKPLKTNVSGSCGMGAEWGRQAVMTGLTVIYWDWTTAKKWRLKVLLLTVSAASAGERLSRIFSYFCRNDSGSLAWEAQKHSGIVVRCLLDPGACVPVLLHPCCFSVLFRSCTQQKLVPVLLCNTYCHSGCFIYKRTVYSAWAAVAEVARQAKNRS